MTAAAWILSLLFAACRRGAATLYIRTVLLSAMPPAAGIVALSAMSWRTSYASCWGRWRRVDMRGWWTAKRRKRQRLRPGARWRPVAAVVQARLRLRAGQQRVNELVSNIRLQAPLAAAGHPGADRPGSARARKAAAHRLLDGPTRGPKCAICYRRTARGDHRSGGSARPPARAAGLAVRAGRRVLVFFAFPMQNRPPYYSGRGHGVWWRILERRAGDRLRPDATGAREMDWPRPPQSLPIEDPPPGRRRHLHAAHGGPCRLGTRSTVAVGS